MPTRLIFVLLGLLLIFTGRSEAYIDPGTGSYFIQGVLAVFFGIILTIKAFYTQIKARVVALLLWLRRK
ncbi:MAG: hypothetical protein ABIH50_02780 [bacterium]